MIKSFTIDDIEYARVLDGVCYQYGYKDLIDGNPNPQSKDDFFDNVIYNFLKENVRAWEINKEVKKTQDIVLENMKTLTLGTIIGAIK